VVLLTLLMAALLDADSLVASVSSEGYGTSRTIELGLVRPFRAVSDALWLNRPHRWLADIAGTNQRHLSAPKSLAVSPAQAAAIASLLHPGIPGGQPRAGHVGGAVHTGGRPAPPGPQTPTAANPLRVWLGGDSLMGTLSDAFLGHVAGSSTVTASADVQIGTGLARPDVYDWSGELAVVLQQHPGVVVVSFGVNDDQDMSSGGRDVPRGTAAWRAEYAIRVASLMDEVTAAGVLLIWVEVPPVQRAQLQQNDLIVNDIVRQQAASHPGVLVVDPAPALAPHGAYSEYLPGSGGLPIEVRAPDGVHLTPAGAERVLPLILAAVRTRWRLP
jgi:hypothetical protein